MTRSAVLIRGTDCATADGQLAASLVCDVRAFPIEAVREALGAEPGAVRAERQEAPSVRSASSAGSPMRIAAWPTFG